MPLESATTPRNVLDDLSDERKAVRRELERVLSKWRFSRYCIPYRYSSTIKLATDEHARSLGITDANILKYEGMILAAAQYLTQKHLKQRITIRAFQAPAGVDAQIPLGDRVTVSYILHSNPLAALNFIVIRDVAGVRAMTVDQYENYVEAEGRSLAAKSAPVVSASLSYTPPASAITLTSTLRVSTGVSGAKELSPVSTAFQKPLTISVLGDSVVSPENRHRQQRKTKGSTLFAIVPANVSSPEARYQPSDGESPVGAVLMYKKSLRSL
ncbi:MAG TPA: hypothetical protein VD770_02295 [Coxiellaceae bacterium]|nr:hypothetical protein [Coxiellaceae bacterium]